MAFEDFAQQYVTLVQDGCMVDAKELVESYQAENGWGPGEEAAIEMMLGGEAVHPPGEPEFMDGLFRHKLTAKSSEFVTERSSVENYREQRLAESYVALCKSGQEDVAEDLRAWAEERVFCGPSASDDFLAAVESLECQV
jgi:hypothetical protein